MNTMKRHMYDEKKQLVIIPQVPRDREDSMKKHTHRSNVCSLASEKECAETDDKTSSVAPGE